MEGFQGTDLQLKLPPSSPVRSRLELVHSRSLKSSKGPYAIHVDFAKPQPCHSFQEVADKHDAGGFPQRDQEVTE